MGSSIIRITRAVSFAAVFGLAGCVTDPNLGVNNGANSTKSPGNQSAVALSPNPQGEVFGQGNVRVAMMLPKTAPGNAAIVSQEIRNGALMAMQDFGQNIIQLVIKDNQGQASRSQDLASESVKEGASAILGPLFAANVSAAAGVTLPAGRTMMAFSSDATVAKRGVYLLSFLPQEDVRTITNYAIGKGRRSIIAFLPANAEGSIREITLRQVATAAAANVQVIKYERSGPGITNAAKSAIAQLATADAIYIPEGGGIPATILKTLNSSGGSIAGKEILGSGAWETVKTSDPILTGAVYPGRDISRFNQFAQRYQAAYGVQPSVMAGIGYDAVTLASELVRQNGAKAFSTAIIENNRGYIGVNGIFRFRANGTAERGLAIYQITGGRGQLLVPAPNSFSNSAS